MHSPMREPINLELFIKLMMMTTSNTDGEALAALRFANAQLEKSGGNWESLLRGKLAPIDPFMTLPEPPQRSAPPPPPPPRQPSYSQSPPPPPPPPIFHGLDKAEAKKISSWIAGLEFENMDSTTQRQFNHVQARWVAHKKLDHTDFDWLRNKYRIITGKRP